NNEFDFFKFEEAAYRILNETKKQYGWIYETLHDSTTKGEIIFNVGSDIISCINCGEDFSYWDSAVNLQKKEVKKDYKCPRCNVVQNNNNSVPSLKTIFDRTYNETRQIPKSEI